jgi:hypothetical protein
VRIAEDDIGHEPASNGSPALQSALDPDFREAKLSVCRTVV